METERQIERKETGMCIARKFGVPGSESGDSRIQAN